MSQYDFDLIVIGAGSGGVRAARMASSYGAKVAIFENDRFGGTCVIRGCVPKKLYAYASRFKSAFEDAGGFGWQVNEMPEFSWQELYQNQATEINRLEMIYESLLVNSGVYIIRGRGSLEGPHEVALEANGEIYNAKYILIATGGYPYKLPVKGADHAITSDDFFLLEDQPESCLVVGGGYIAVELASVLNGFGTKTSLSYRGHLLLRTFDTDLSKRLRDDLRASGIDLLLESQVTEITEKNNLYQVTFEDGSKGDFDQVLFATGRKPNTGNLGLEEVGVTLDEGGFIKVDEYSQTSVPSIYAVGDVTGRAALTPVAIREGAAVVETLFNDNKTKVDHSLIATAVFTTPEIGTVGLTETEAWAHKRKIDVYEAEFRPLAFTLAGREQKIYMKLIVDQTTDIVLGAHMLGPDAAEIIQMAAIAIGMGATKADFDKTMAVHPTAAEEFVTMKTIKKVRKVKVMPVAASKNDKVE